MLEWPGEHVLSYVLITPARNEEALIARTIASVVTQTVYPTRWVIVDDGSTDQTAATVLRLAEPHPWISLIKLPPHQDRNFAAKVWAFNAGYTYLAGVEYQVIGNVDADISFEADYMEFLLRRFEEDPSLGVAGTSFIEQGYDSSRDSFEGQTHVAGGCQLFRRQCFGEIGAYVPVKGGGVDWIAVTTARMRGWKTRAFTEKSFVHHRRMGTAERSPISAMFHAGERDYRLGKSPVHQVFRAVYRMTKDPRVFGGLAILAGYTWALLRRMPRSISQELIDFRRREDSAKLSRVLSSLLQGKKVDKFYLLD